MTNGPDSLPRPSRCLPADDEPWLENLSRLEGAYAPSTIRTTIRSFRFFQTWCAQSERVAFPADGVTIAAFVDAYASIFTPRTMQNHLQGIQLIHLAADFPSPIHEELARVAIRRHMRLARRPRRPFEVTADIRDRLAAGCPGDLVGLRDCAMVNLAYDTLCYRSELTTLQVEDLRPLPDGTAELRLRQPHASLRRRGDLVFLSARGLQAVSAWLAAAGIKCGPILRGVRNRRPSVTAMQPRTVGVRLKVIASRAGLSEQAVSRITSHSFRVGAVQSLAGSGRTLLQIMRAGRWCRPDTPARYLREAAVEIWTGSDGDIYPVLPSIQIRRGLKRLW